MAIKSKDSLDDVLSVFRTLHRLKEIPRQGFVHFRFKREETDSVAEHSFMVTWISYVLAWEFAKKRGLGRGGTLTAKGRASVRDATVMALTHDWAEAIAGDVSYHAKEGFGEIEQEAFGRLVRGLKNEQELTKRWHAYERKTGFAAAIVKCADAFDAWIQGLTTPSRWWPAWEDYNRQTFLSLDERCRPAAHTFQRMCEIARDPEARYRLSPPSEALDDNVVAEIVRFVKAIYCLKELPRHGFTMFGMKRSETDTIAGHSFTSASLAYLLASLHASRKGTETREPVFDTLLIALVHDLPTAVTGDVAYDIQRKNTEWSRDKADKGITLLLGKLACAEEVRAHHRQWLDMPEQAQSVIWARAAAGLDAWEMGLNTPSSWPYGWNDYRQQVFSNLKAMRATETVMKTLERAYSRLADGVVMYGRWDPEIRPRRLC